MWISQNQYDQIIIETRQVRSICGLILKGVHKLSDDLQSVNTALANLGAAITADTNELGALAVSLAALEGRSVPAGTFSAMADQINAFASSVNAAVASAVTATTPAPVPTPTPTPDPTATGTTPTPAS